MKSLLSMRGFALAIVLVGTSTALAEEFSARLGRVPVDTRTQSEVAGIGRATAELDGDRLTIEGDFSGLLGAATEANLHMGIATGARGQVIHSLEIDAATDGEVNGAIRLSNDEIAALQAGRLYIQIHSVSAPDGNLWGWLLSE